MREGREGGREGGGLSVRVIEKLFTVDDERRGNENKEIIINTEMQKKMKRD